MNKRIKKLAEQADKLSLRYANENNVNHVDAFNIVFAKLIIEETLTQVAERAYYTGDRDWSDEVDRPWIQLEFGYGSLADAKNGIFK